MSVILGQDNEEFELADFLGTGHAEILPALGTRPAEERWPVRIFARMLESVTLSYIGTSTDSLTIADSGSISPTLSTGKSYGVGTRVKLARTSAPTTTYMEGVVTAYNSTTGAATITLDNKLGSGTHSDWTVTLSGDVGETGPAGSGLSDVVDDTTPQLGGPLDTNGNAIVSASAADIDITPDSTGEINANKKLNVTAGGLDVTGDTTAQRGLTSESSAQTFALADANTIQEYTGSGTDTWTIPANATVAFATGTEIEIVVTGSGTFTLEGAASVIVNGVTAGSITIEQYNAGVIKKTATNTWIYSGQNQDAWA